jgi:hypothetical protein
MPLSAHVSTVSGQILPVAEGNSLVFGRGPGVDLVIAAGRGLSRRAGVVTAMAAGVWIANISRTHALYVEGDGYQVRLPRMEKDGEPANGWFVHTGTALVGSRTMLDEGQSLVVTVSSQYEEAAARSGWADETVLADEVEWTDEVDPADGTAQLEMDDARWSGARWSGARWSGAGAAGRTRATGSGLPYGGLDPMPQAGPGHAGEAGRTREADGPGLAARDGEGTLLPFYLDPMTKLFLVALIWCRPWLDDPSATRPLPRTPEIARSALEVTGAYHELERFDADPEYRDLLSARVAEHIKVLRRKIADRGLAPADVRLSDEVAVRILIEHGIITSADLSRLDDPAWRSRQEDLWWTQS